MLSVAENAFRPIFEIRPLMNMKVANLTLEQKMQGFILLAIGFAAFINYVV